ncbi:MAG: malto-oligosyltrehalose synthase, partial [Chloroflexota bacterium]
MMTPDFTTLVNEVASELIAQKRIPRATYRMQFHKDFTFRDAEALVPYLDTLGISDLYASPILKAVPGSTHGYDICDPRQLNPELGRVEDFLRLSAALQARGMGLLIDIVPNHMGIGSDCNAWWLDVLEHGRESKYADFFDIEWNPAKHELRDKVLLPILEDQYGNVLESGKLVVGYDRSKFYLTYGERRLPIAPETYGMIAEGHSKKALAQFNGTVGDPRSFDALDELINAQHYRLAYWRVAGEEINYRRFFDINTMAAIHNELPEVFAATHGLVFDLLSSGYVTGLRIDHPDGLWNPPAYFRKLHESAVLYRIPKRQRELLQSSHPFPVDFRSQPAQKKAAEQAELEQEVSAWFDSYLSDEGKLPQAIYVVAEKILSETEPLPLDWAVDGTTGYDFLNLVNSLFVDNTAEADLSRIFADFTRRPATISQLEYASKKRTMETSLAGELHLLARRLARLTESNRHTRDFTFSGLHYALREVIACLPIYRTYITGRD